MYAEFDGTRNSPHIHFYGSYYKILKDVIEYGGMTLLTFHGKNVNSFSAPYFVGYAKLNDTIDFEY